MTKKAVPLLTDVAALYLVYNPIDGKCGMTINTSLIEKIRTPILSLASVIF